MSQPLTDNEIKKRLVRLQNLERLYAELQEKYQRLKIEYIALLELVKLQAKQIHEQQLRIEELEKMVFGKKKRIKPEPVSPTDANSKEASGIVKYSRPSATYRRQLPTKEEITDTQRFSIIHCPDCGGVLTYLKEIIRYVEDMRLPTAIENLFKKVEKHCIMTGYCSLCKKRYSADKISP